MPHHAVARRRPARRPRRLGLAAATALLAATAPRAEAGKFDAPAVILIGEMARAIDGLDRLMYAVSDLEDLPWQLTETYDQVLNDPVLGPLVLNLANLYADRSWHASAYGHLTAESSGTTGVAAGAEVRWESGLCRLLGATVDGQLYHDTDDRGGAYAAGVSGCLPLPGNTLEVGYRRSHEIRPSLLALPLGRGGRYSAETFDLGVRFWRIRTAQNQIDIAPLAFTVDDAHEPVDGGELDTLQVDFGMRIARWTRRSRGFLGGDRAWDFGLIRVRDRQESGLPDAGVTSAISFTLAPVRVEGLHLADDLHLDAEVGATGGEFLDGGDLPARQFWHATGELTLWTGTDAINGSLGLRRALEPVTGEQLLAEDRLATSLTTRWGPTLTTIDGYLATARVETFAGPGDRHQTAALGAKGGVGLGHGLALWLRGEVGRTMTAEPMTGALAPTTGARVMLSVSGQAGWQR